MSSSNHHHQEEEDKFIILKYSLTSGIFASLSSVCGKLATSGHLWDTILIKFLDKFQWEFLMLKYSIQIIWFLLMVLTNSIMWHRFSLALSNIHSTTLQVTGISTAANFISTGLFGWLIFNENITWQWIMGIGMIISGLLLIKQNEPEKITTTTEKKTN